MFSLPYVLGTVMVQGDVWLGDFTPEAIQEGKRLAAADKIEIVRDADIDRESKQRNLALSLHSLVIYTKDGRTISKKLDHAKGFPQNSMTLEDCMEKVRKMRPICCKGNYGWKDGVSEKSNRGP
jgi:2-methylcitrate dehydratase PrpD